MNGDTIALNGPRIKHGNDLKGNDMKLHLTRGMFGDKIAEIGTETENVKTVLEYIFAWKNDDVNKRQYKIEKYDRLVFGNSQIAIDFGDYATFFLVDDVSEEQKRQFTAI